jgi:hypothetical protein
MSVRYLYPRELVVGAECLLTLYADHHLPHRDAPPRDPAFALFQQIEQEEVVSQVRAAYPHARCRAEDAPWIEGAAGAESASETAAEPATEPATPAGAVGDGPGQFAGAGDGPGQGHSVVIDPALSRRRAQTERLLEERTPLFDAYFAAAGVACRVELMLPSGEDSWDVVLIRSGTGLRGGYITEAAVTRYCLEASGVPVAELYVCFLNKEYTGEATSAQELLKWSRVTSKVRKQKLDVAGLVGRARAVLSRPKTVLNDAEWACGGGHQCRICRRFEESLPRHNVYTLHRGGKQVKELTARGIVRIAEIDSGDLLTGKQQVQWRAVVEDALQVDGNGVDAFLRRIEYPVSFLDFEAYQRAVPGYTGVVPWQHLPFQFSLHVVAEPNAAPEWYSFIASESGEAHAEVAAELLRVMPREGSVFVYGAGFENGVLSALAEQFPERAEELESVRGRLIDMADPFREFSVYHPEQLGKTSLKRVLPLYTNSSYEGLALSDGMQASLAYYFLRRGQVPRQFGRDAAEVRARLTEYCGLDTYALYLLWGELERQRNSSSISVR